jgi:hypothetical protein
MAPVGDERHRRLARVAQHIGRPSCTHRIYAAAQAPEPPPHPAAAFCSDDPPINWGLREWAAMAERQEAAPLLQLEQALRGFDMDSFIRDGVAVFPGCAQSPPPDSWG